MKRIALCLILVLAASGCNDVKLRDIIAASDKVADTTLIIQQAALDAETTGLLTRNQTRKVMSVSIAIFKANDEAMSLAKELSKLDEPSRAQLSAILVPLIATLDRVMKDEEILGIKDDATRTTILLSFQTVLVTLRSSQAILEAAK